MDWYLIYYIFFANLGMALCARHAPVLVIIQQAAFLLHIYCIFYTFIEFL